MTQSQIGEFREEIVKILDLQVKPGTPIYIGESNLAHMAENHPRDFRRYGERLQRIIADPDYVGLHNDGSVEYIKSWGRYIKVAVRVAGDGLYYARTLYRVMPKLAQELVESGRWKPLTKNS